MEQIYKYRSFSASIASGYKLFRANIRTILSKSWIEALASGLILGAGLVSMAYRCKIAVIICAIALVIAVIFWNGRLFQLIDGGKPKEKLWRATKAMIWSIPFCLLPLIGVPIINVVMEIMLEEKPKIGRALKTGFRHWGYLFSTLLMSCIIILLLSLVLCVPLYICFYGLIKNNYGIEYGDPSGLPSSFPYILLFVGTLTGFIFPFIQLWQTYALAFAHGAILTRDKFIQEQKVQSKKQTQPQPQNQNNKNEENESTVH